MPLPPIPESHLAGPAQPERRFRFIEIVRRKLLERRYAPRTQAAYEFWVMRGGCPRADPHGTPTSPGGHASPHSSHRDRRLSAPQAPQSRLDWRWAYLFPASRTVFDAGGARRRHHLHETVIQRAIKTTAT